ncbi:phytanoyl-CoA dioxygenase family protein [Caulobacter segnis]|uniref:phytanoyl-CoA dioxygenase family protein n=1 Tax=Caulobacter segnis TaxID=88688 RepID=UPI0024103467|nr:phytanoyl-CoA dioxygenase family protein [Caulobacter segnis]MDG2521275.1 phytanoyl-CoA dioxygenase family protein [Caulobacter segnis]
MTEASAEHASVDASSLVRDLTREEFWRETFLGLTIHDLLRAEFPLNPLSDASAVLADQKMRLEGYFQDRDEQLVDLADRLSHAIEHCAQLGIPPVFIFLFDEAWAAFYRQHQMLSKFLGPDCQVLPDFWAWRVDPTAGQAGWKPHRDKGSAALAPDGTPLSLTMWVPLNEASPLNGCMYLLPANRDPVYGTPQDKNWQIDLPSIRALPGAPGDYFIWNQAVLHWGGQSSAFAQKPRISMALEFQRADVAPFNRPLLGTLPFLTFQDRLKLIAKQITQYKHMYPLPPEMQALAQKVLTG